MPAESDSDLNSKRDSDDGGLREYELSELLDRRRTLGKKNEGGRGPDGSGGGYGDNLRATSNGSGWFRMSHESEPKVADGNVATWMDLSGPDVAIRDLGGGTLSPISPSAPQLSTT